MKTSGRRVRVRWAMACAAALALASALSAGCLDARREGAQGDACRSSAECGAGLICVAQACEPAPVDERPSRADAAFADGSGGDGRDVPTADIPPGEDAPGPGEDAPGPVEDVAVAPDVPGPPDPVCVPGERACASNQEVQICAADGLSFAVERCAQGTVCQQGACRARERCEDADRDGFSAGPDCPGVTDCNDDNPEVFPGRREVCDGLDNDCDGVVDVDGGAPLQRACASACGQGRQACRGGLWGACEPVGGGTEVCGDGVDNDCDGQIDEGCGCCEPGSCPNGQLCDGCACVVPPDDACVFQNQPCDPARVRAQDPLFCVDIFGNGEGICMGLCDYGAANANATCPAPDSTCAFQTDGAEGLCLSACDPATQTGCFSGQGCLALPNGGGCVPSGPIPELEACDAFEGVFGQCEAGTACIEAGGGGEGACVRLCDPSAVVEQGQTSCRLATGCQPVGDGFGFCLPALGRETGAECARFERGQPCNAESICVGRGRGDFACLALCRIGAGDCPDGRLCRFSDDVFDADYGVCQ